jgi:hypothetical protein
MIAKGLTLNIGRHAGEIEDAKKALVSAKGGHRDPRRAGFWGIDECAEGYTRAVSFANAKAKDGRLLKGVPDDKWAAALAADPLRPLEPEHLHVFLPETRDLTLRGGSVLATLGGKVLAWREPELFAYLGDGYALTVKFDPAEPALGCALFNRETGTRNRDGWALGLYLGQADYEPEAPQIIAARGFLIADEVESLARRKRYTSAIRAEYRGIVGRDRPVVRASENRNGRGEIVRVESGAARAAAPPPPTPVAPDRGLAPPKPRRAEWRDRMMAEILGG